MEDRPVRATPLLQPEVAMLDRRPCEPARAAEASGEAADAARYRRRLAGQTAGDVPPGG